MPSPLGSFLLTLCNERQHHGVDHGEETMQVFVSDNANMMRRTSCASYPSSNDISAPDVFVISDNATIMRRTLSPEEQKPRTQSMDKNMMHCYTIEQVHPVAFTTKTNKIPLCLHDNTAQESQDRPPSKCLKGV
jgi:hypothetical protein